MKWRISNKVNLSWKINSTQESGIHTVFLARDGNKRFKLLSDEDMLYCLRVGGFSQVQLFHKWINFERVWHIIKPKSTQISTNLIMESPFPQYFRLVFICYLELDKQIFQKFPLRYLKHPVFCRVPLLHAGYQTLNSRNPQIIPPNI